MQDLNDKITGNTLSAAEWNQVPSELQNVIESLGMVLSSGDLNQLGKAIAGYVANGNYYTDSGAANAYVLTPIGSKQSAPSLTDGFTARFIPQNANTTAATVNVNSYGVKNIKRPDGTDTQAGDIEDRAVIVFDAANDYFILESFAGVASETTQGTVELASPAETITGEDNSRAVTPFGLAAAGAAHVPVATTAIQGKVELATSAEVSARSDGERAVTSQALDAGYDIINSQGSNGYQIMPGGTIVQWGSANITPNTNTTVTLPLTFPTACLQAYACYATALLGNGFDGYSAGADPISTSQIRLWSNTPAGVGVQQANWFAIGY